MATRRATVVGALLLAAAIFPGCVKKVEYEFHIRNATDKGVGVEMDLPGGGTSYVGRIPAGERKKHEVNLSAWHLPGQCTIKAGSRRKTFRIRDYSNTDEVDLFLRITPDAILGPALSPDDLRGE